MILLPRNIEFGKKSEYWRVWAVQQHVMRVGLMHVDLMRVDHV